MKLKLFSPLAVIIISLIGTLYSCKEFIEPNISKSQVTLEAPFNNYQSASYTVNFWWDEVPDALHYRLQIVTPNFDSVGSLVLDSLVAGNKFALNLVPGKYQWRVSAENGSSSTAFSAVRSFIVSNSSIKQQSIQLSSPANNTVTNQSSTIFQWSSLYGATGYRLEIDTNNFQNESAVIYNQLVPGQQVSFTFPKDQVYQWRVRAENDTVQSQWSAVNIITYDHTPPAQVSLSSPANNLTISLPVSLQWNAVTSAAKYKLYVFQSDSTTAYNQNFPMILSTTSYSFNLGVSGDRIYWKVSAIDAAGNEGEASALRSFVLQ